MCVVLSEALHQSLFVMSSTIVPNVLTPTLVGAPLFVKYSKDDSWSG